MHDEGVTGFQSSIRNARIGLVRRYEFQDNYNTAERQKHVRVSEAQADQLT